jgi:hypothetical protein
MPRHARPGKKRQTKRTRTREKTSRTAQSASGSPSLANLLAQIDETLVRYVVFKCPFQRILVTLWVAHTHTIAAATVTPYLHIRSSEPESGKTRLLEVLELLVADPWRVTSPSEATLYRKTHQGTITLLFDEADTTFGHGKTPRSEGIRAILDAGYRAGNTVPRCQGEGYEVIDFQTFCAKAFAGLGQLPHTVVSRSIPVDLPKRMKAEPIERFYQREAARDLSPIQAVLDTWAKNARSILRDSRPELPDGLSDRTAEVLEPLLAIAALAGGSWPERARTAALTVFARRHKDRSLNVQLLAAIRDIFDARKSARIFTTDLLKALVNREHEPWGGWWGTEVDRAGRGVPRKAAIALARRLSPFDIEPKQIRHGRLNARGYLRADFTDAWNRHLGPSSEEDHGSGSRAGSAAHPSPDTASRSGTEARPADSPAPPEVATRGRYNATTVAAQGLEVATPVNVETEVATPQTLGTQGLYQRSDLDSAKVASPAVSRSSVRRPEGRKPLVCRVCGFAECGGCYDYDCEPVEPPICPDCGEPGCPGSCPERAALNAEYWEQRDAEYWETDCDERWDGD